MINKMRYMLGRSLCVIAILMIYGDIESNANVLLVNIPMHIILNEGGKNDSSSKATNSNKSIDITKLNNKIKILNSAIVSLKNDTTSLKKEIVSLKNDTTSLKKEIASLQNDTTSLKKENNELIQKLKTLQTQNKDPENKDSDDVNTFNPLYIFLSAISLLSMYLFSRNKKLQKDIDKKHSVEEDIRKELEKCKEDLRQREGIIEANNRLLNERQNDITNLKKRLDEANKKLINAEVKYQPNRENIPNTEIKEIPKVVEKLFMSNPNKDGTFSSEEKITIYDQTSCYYEFEKTGDNLYEFFLINEVAARALKYNDTVIVPVCDSIEGSSRNCEKIIMVTKGKAELDGSVFRVIEKAQIKYV